MNKLVTMTAAALLASAASTSANTLVFGDSLSDGGAAEATTLAIGGEWPYSVYPNGQFTNGDTWATKIGSSFESGYNFAFGGARAVDNGDAIPDFAAQIDNFVNSGTDASTVDEVAIWFGGNDFRDLLFSANAPTQDDIQAGSAAIIGEIFGGIGQLATLGLTDFVVFGLPDLGTLPSVVDTANQPLVSSIIGGYNTALQNQVLGFSTLTGLDVSYFDAAGLADEVFANAGALGITNTKESCLSRPLECAQNPNQFFFYDDLHPTDVVHGELAKAFTAQVVPLPAGMPLVLSGLVLLGLVSRRNKSRA